MIKRKQKPTRQCPRCKSKLLVYWCRKCMLKERIEERQSSLQDVEKMIDEETEKGLFDALGFSEYQELKSKIKNLSPHQEGKGIGSQPTSRTHITASADNTQKAKGCGRSWRPNKYQNYCECWEYNLCPKCKQLEGKKVEMD